MSYKAFTFNGVSSRTFGIVATGQTNHNAPARSYDSVAVLGRDGDLLMDNRRFPNVEIGYHIATRDISNLADVRAWLLAPSGYVKLTDEYNPDEFYLAKCEDISIDTTANRYGTSDITFTRKPQRFLTSGEVAQTFTESGNITNPTKFASKPLLRIYGKGTVKLGDSTITVNKAGTNYIDFDCDILSAYEGSANRNGNISLSGTPKLQNTTIITLTGVEKVVITPRWWRI